MQRYRWIYVPLTFASLYAISYIVFGFGASFPRIAVEFTFGAVLGFILLLYGSIKTRRLEGENEGDIHKVKRDRRLTLLVDREKALEICVAAVESLGSSKIKYSKLNDGNLEVRTGMTWDSFGSLITFRLTALNDNLTEVAISSRPVLRTTLIDYGEGWKYIEHICDFLKARDAEINRTVLREGVDILHEIFVGDIREGSVRIRTAIDDPEEK